MLDQTYRNPKLFSKLKIKTSKQHAGGTSVIRTNVHDMSMPGVTHAMIATLVTPRDIGKTTNSVLSSFYRFTSLLTT